MKSVNIDGVNFNAAHYVKKGKEEGITALIDDHEANDHTKGMDWEQVYKKLETAVEKETK